MRFALVGRKAAGPILPLLITVAVALAGRLYALGQQPFWLDEAITLHRASLPLPALVHDSLHNWHLPTYFLALSPLAGPEASEVVLRLPSAIAGALAAGLTAAIAWELAGLAAGLAAGLLMALAPIEVAYSQEARSYAVMLCLLLLAFWGLLRLARAPTTGAGAGGERCAWLAWAIGSAGALDVLANGMLWFFASLLGLAAIARSRPAGERSLFLRRWGLAGAVVLAATAPLYRALLFANPHPIFHAFGWIPPLTPAFLWRTIAPLFLLRISNQVSFRLVSPVLPGLGGVVLALAAFGFWHLRARRTVRLALIAILFVPPLLIAILSLRHNLLIPRYLLAATAPFLILAGTGIGALPRPLHPVALPALAVALVLNLLPYYHMDTRPRWDLAATALAPLLGPKDAILIHDAAIPVILGLYLRRQGHSQPLERVYHAEDARKVLAAGGHVWAIYGRVGQGQMEEQAEFLARLGRLGPVAEALEPAPGFLIERFDPPPPLSGERSAPVAGGAGADGAAISP